MMAGQSPAASAMREVRGTLSRLLARVAAETRHHCVERQHAQLRGSLIAADRDVVTFLRKAIRHGPRLPTSIELAEVEQHRA